MCVCLSNTLYAATGGHRGRKELLRFFNRARERVRKNDNETNAPMADR